jgi:hypothetical protein
VLYTWGRKTSLTARFSVLPQISSRQDMGEMLLTPQCKKNISDYPPYPVFQMQTTRQILALICHLTAHAHCGSCTRQLHCGSCTAAAAAALRQLHGSCTAAAALRQLPLRQLPLRPACICTGAAALGHLHWGICNAARISANREAGPYLFSLRYLSRKFWNHVLPKMLEYLLRHLL